MKTDNDGFEIPDDVEVCSEEELLYKLSYSEELEYNYLLIDTPALAEKFKNRCIKEHIQKYLDKKNGKDEIQRISWDEWNEHRRILHEKGPIDAEKYMNKIIKNNIERWLNTHDRR